MLIRLVVLFLASGCLGKKPVLRLQEFSPACPQNNSVTVSVKGTVDLSGVAKGPWTSVSLIQKASSTIQSTGFGTCSSALSGRFYCQQKVGELYTVVYTDIVKEVYRNKEIQLRMINDTFPPQMEVLSSSVLYPVIKNSIKEVLEVGGREVALSRDPVRASVSGDFNIKYSVSGAGRSLTVSILDQTSAVMELASSVDPEVTFASKGNRQMVFVSYSIPNGCSKSTNVTFVKHDSDDDSKWWIALIFVGILGGGGGATVFFSYRHYTGKKSGNQNAQNKGYQSSGDQTDGIKDKGETKDREATVNTNFLTGPDRGTQL